MRYDICVIGAGLLGLATAREILARHPSLHLLVIDKEDHIAAHQSSHNSGVVHSGLYYLPGSLKARLCLEGRGLLERLSAERDIPYERCGKVVVALEEAERPRLVELYRRGTANGVTGIRLIGAQELREIEPNTEGIAAIRVPTTGILDFTRVAAVYAEDIMAGGGEVRVNCELRGLRKLAASAPSCSGSRLSCARPAIPLSRCAPHAAHRWPDVGGTERRAGHSESRLPEARCAAA